MASKNQYALAEQELTQLIKNNPQEKIYRMSLAEVYQSQHQYSAAIQLLQDTLKSYPDDEALTIQTAQTLMLAERYQDVETLLEKQVRKIKNNPQLYHLLAQAYSELGQAQASHVARAEYYAMQDDWHSAVRELKRAQALNKDNAYQQAKIASRLKEVEAQLDLKKT